MQLRVYKFELSQLFQSTDHAQRKEFVESMMKHQEVNDEFSNKFVFSDEAHFHLDGFGNRQNCRIWGTENLEMIFEKQM